MRQPHTVDESFRLQPLRIPSGWSVLSNNLYEVEPIENSVSCFGMYLLLLSCARCNQSIDVGWEPEYELNGYFKVLVMNTFELFDEKSKKYTTYSESVESLCFKTNNRLELVSRIEKLMCIHECQADPRILKCRGVLDQPSESFRLNLKKDGFSEELGKLIIEKGNRDIQILLIEEPNVSKMTMGQLAEEGIDKRVRNRAKHKLNSPKLWKKI